MKKNEPQQPVRLLIVDDNPEDGLRYRKMLSKNKVDRYSFIETDSGEKGLQMVMQDRVDCVLLDYHLPDMDGIEFLESLMESKLLSSTSIVFLTGQGSEAVAVRAMKNGASDYLIKDAITADMLRRSIQFAIEKRKSEQALKEGERMKGALEMAGAICHELNQPLQVVSSQVDLLMMTVAEKDSLHQKLVKIMAGVQQMGGLTRKLMGIVRYRTKAYATGGQIIDIDQSTNCINHS